jgi:hypothetical protein
MSEEQEWIVRFLNLPSEEQISFLYRYALEENVRIELEKKMMLRDLNEQSD